MSGLCRTQSFACVSKNDRQVHEVCPRLFIGSAQAAASLESLRDAGITHVVNASVYADGTICGTEKKPKVIKIK